MKIVTFLNYKSDTKVRCCANSILIDSGYILYSQQLFLIDLRTTLP